MHGEPIEEVYFNWLYSKVASVDNPTPSLTYYTLLRDLHATEFAWLRSGDDNRLEDGIDLRKEFLREALLDQDPAWMNIPCSVLEMLIAFTRRASFDTSIGSREWFWIFMDNLGLAELSDARDGVSEKVYDVMDRFVWRTYGFNGMGGGLFPLSRPKKDQRKVELWYQFCAWIEEKDIL